MKKFYTQILLAITLLFSSSVYAQVTGLMADDANPCPNQTVNISWTLGSGGGGPYFIQVGTTGPGSQDITSGSQPSNNFQVIAQTAGQTYTVTVTGTGGGPGSGIATSTTLTTENTLSAPTAFTVDGSGLALVCANTSFDLDATGGYGGSKGALRWGTDNVTFPNASPFTVGAGIAVPTNFYVRYESTCGVGGTVSGSLTAPVSVHTAPSAATGVTASVSPICPGVPVSFTATGGTAGTNPANTIEFQFNGGGYTASNTVASPTSGVPINVDVRRTDACDAATYIGGTFGPFAVNTASTAVTDVTYTGQPAAYCSGANITFTANGGALGTGGFYEYSLDGTNWVNNAGSNTHVVNGAGTPSTTVYFRITDDCGNTTAQNVTATAYVNPTNVTSVSASPAGNVCMGTVVSYTAMGGTLGNHPGSEYQYQVNGGGFVSNGATNFIAMAVNASTTVDFIIIDGCTGLPVGAASSATTNVAVNNIGITGVLTDNSAPVGTTCGTEDITFSTDLTETLGDNAVYQYRYQTTASASPTAWAATDNSGIDPFVTLTITEDIDFVEMRIFGGCNDVSAMTASSGAINYQIANVAPTSLDAVASVCGDEQVIFTAMGYTLGDGASFEYNQDGNGWLPTLNAGTDDFIDLLVTAATSVDFRIIGGCNNVSGTTVNASVTYDVANVAVTTVTPDAATVCGPTMVNFLANGTLGDNAVYEYSTDGTNWTVTGNLGADNFIDINVTADITVDMRINGGCNDVSLSEGTTTVTYSEPSVAPTALASDNAASVCPNTVVRFSLDGTLGDGATFEYQINGGGYFTTTTAGTDNFVDVTVMASTAYAVDMRINGGCNNISGVVQSNSVTGYAAQPTVTSVTIDKDNICANSGEIVTLTTYTSAVVSNPPYTYEWYTFNPTTNGYDYLLSDTDGDLQQTPTVTTTYAVRIEGCGVTSPYVATLVTVKTVSVVPTSISVSPNDTVCAGATVALTANGGVAGTGAILEWFDGTNTIGFGNPFFINLTADMDIQARYNGDCNVTAYTAVTGLRVYDADDLTILPGVVCAGSTLNLAPLATPAGGSFSGANVTGNTFMSNTPSATNTVTYTKTFPGGCVFSKDFNVVVNPLPVATASAIVPASCNGGGSFTLTASGTVSPYTFSNDNGLNYVAGNISVTEHSFAGLTAGTYQARVKGNAGCVSAPVSVIVANTSGLTLNTVKTDVTCSGTSNGTITASSTLGLAPYTFAISSDGGATWSAEQSSGVFSALGGGTYSIRVSDSNSPACTVINSGIIISVPALIDLTVDNYNSVTCFGGNDGKIENIFATGGNAPYTFNINPGAAGYGTQTTFNNLVAGVYTITVKDATGCLAPFSFSINTPTEIVSTVELLNYDAVNGYDVKIRRTGGTGSLEIKLGAAAYTLDSIFNDLQPGTYTYTIKDNAGCTITETFTLVDPTSVGTISKNVELSVYPNPFSGVINITGEIADGSVITLVDLYGKAVKANVSQNGNHTVINTDDLAKGMYILTIKGNGVNVSKKVIKE